MTNKTISRRYAKAFLAIGREDGRYLEYGEELRQLVALFDEHEDFADTLANPIFNLDTRQRILEAVLAKVEASEMVKNFLHLLLQRNRIRFLAGIVEYYTKLTDELQGISPATLISATPLSDDVIERIKEAVARITNKQIRLQVEVDPSLIGGVVTKVGDLNFDGSVRTQLLSLKESLKRGE